MKSFLFFLICFVIEIVQPTILYAQNGLPTDLLTIGDNSQQKATSVPDPQALSADWWRFFEVDKTQLKERVFQVIEALNQATARLSNDSSEEAVKKAKQIENNLLLWLELKQKDAPTPPLSHETVPQNDTLEGWLAIHHKIHLLQADYKLELDNVHLGEKRTDNMQKNVDALTAAYIPIAANSDEKIAKGIDLMFAWTEMAVFNERLQNQRQKLTSYQENLKQLQRLAETSIKTIRVDTKQQKKLQGKIAAAEQELAARRDNSTKLALSLPPESSGSDEDKLKAQMYEQRLRQSNIMEVIAETEVLQLKLEYSLLDLLEGLNKTDIAELRNRYQKTIEYLSSVENDYGNWRTQTERDQGRASRSLAALALLENNQQPNLRIKSLLQQWLRDLQDNLLVLQKLDTQIEDTRLLNQKIGDILGEKEGNIRGGYEDLKYNASKALGAFWQRLSVSLFKIGDTPVTLFGILRVVLIMTVAIFLSHFVRHGLGHLHHRQPANATFLYTLGRLSHYVILIIGISIALSSIGVDLSNFALIAGALSLGIGFGLQAIVSNFVSGLIILFERSLRVGDFVELSSGLAGEVKAVNVRSTLVTTPDMVDILVPNSEFVNGKVINWTLTDASRRVHIPFGVAYGSDKDSVRKAGLEAAHKVPFTVKSHSGREAEVWLVGFGDSSLDFELIVWVQPDSVKKPNRVKAAYYWELETALREAGIEIPFPQQDVHIRSSAMAKHDCKHQFDERI